MKRFMVLSILLVPLWMWAQGQQNINWTSLNLTSPVNRHVSALSVVDTQIIWGTICQFNFVGSQVFRTIDGGQTYTFTQLPVTATGALIYDIYALNKDTAYTATSSVNGAQIEGVHRTTDGGTNWDLIFDSDSFGVSVFQIHFFNGNEGVLMGNILSASTSSLFYFTQDGGDTWTQSNGQFFNSCLYFESLGKIYAVAGDTLWYGGGIKNQIFRSVDRGRVWTAHNLPTGADASVLDLAFKNSQEGLALSSFRCGSGETDNLIFKTTDGGDSWAFLTTIKFPFNVTEANNLAYIPGTAGAYITTSGLEPGDDDGYITLDDGNNWTPVLSPSNVYQTTFLSPSHGFAGTNTNDGGLLKFADDLFSSVGVEDPGVPSKISLFPNPSSGLFHLQLDNAWRGDIELSAYTLQGQKIFTQILRKDGQAGEWELSMAGYAPGCYQWVLSHKAGVLNRAVWVW